MFNFKQYNFKNYNISLIILVILQTSIGAFLIRLVQREGENIFVKQILGIIVGLFIIGLVSVIDYHFICELYILMYIFNLGLLIAVKLVGVEIYGAQRWLDMGFFNLQPSELSKVIMILVMAKLYTMLREKMNSVLALIIPGIIMAIPTYLILIQTDLSSSMVLMFIFVMIVFAAGLSYKIIFPIIIIGIPLALGLFWYVQQDFQIILEDYQQERLLSILNQEEYADTMYQQDNSIQVIGSGRLSGKLLTEGIHSIQSDTFVPVSESDFIFSVAGEALGFIGSCVIILIYCIIIFKIFNIARHAADRMGMLIATGVASMFMFQVFVNIGVATAILPNTGLPLPFLSYGLSSLLSSMIAIGIVSNISLQQKIKRG
ncbi:MAG: putative rane protein [Anaerocolumna sp.]|jgi:rod shape determining protein RodA|nr:putative rane protein [Anaerocolumna sp.]